MSDAIQFETFGEQTLSDMLEATKSFLSDASGNGPARWLSFLGTSGAGKTYLCSQAYRLLRRSRLNGANPTLINAVMRYKWPELLSDLRNGDYWKLREARDATVCFVDEVLVEHDPSGFAKDKLFQLFESRVGKWTLVTSNLTFERLQTIDHRLTSRMIRDKGSVVIEVETKDYALR